MMEQPHKLFLGTNNPRHRRVLDVLLQKSLTRPEIDTIAGASNGPELIAELRRRGLAIPCEYVQVVDRDGKSVRSGIYCLTEEDRQMLLAWLTKQASKLSNTKN